MVYYARKGNSYRYGELDGEPVVYIRSSADWDVEFIVDEDRFEEVKRFTWKCANGYAVAWGIGERIRMHQLIKGKREGMETDHINGNRADNRASNLRLVPKGVNLRNVKAQARNGTGLRGVQRKGVKWEAKVGYQGKRLRLGLFATPEEASVVVEDFVRRLEQAEEEAYYMATGHRFSDPGEPIAV